MSSELVIDRGDYTYYIRQVLGERGHLRVKCSRGQLLKNSTVIDIAIKDLRDTFERGELEHLPSFINHADLGYSISKRSRQECGTSGTPLDYDPRIKIGHFCNPAWNDADNSVEGDLFLDLDSEQGLDAWEAFKAGNLRGVSLGFAHNVPDYSGKIDYISPTEVSLTNEPLHQECLVLSAHSKSVQSLVEKLRSSRNQNSTITQMDTQQQQQQQQQVANPALGNGLGGHGSLTPANFLGEPLNGAGARGTKRGADAVDTGARAGAGAVAVPAASTNPLAAHIRAAMPKLNERKADVTKSGILSVLRDEIKKFDANADLSSLQDGDLNAYDALQDTVSLLEPGVEGVLRAETIKAARSVASRHTALEAELQKERQRVQTIEQQNQQWAEDYSKSKEKDLELTFSVLQELGESGFDLNNDEHIAKISGTINQRSEAFMGNILTSATKKIKTQAEELTQVKAELQMYKANNSMQRTLESGKYAVPAATGPAPVAVAPIKTMNDLAKNIGNAHTLAMVTRMRNNVAQTGSTASPPVMQTGHTTYNPGANPLMSSSATAPGAPAMLTGHSQTVGHLQPQLTQDFINNTERHIKMIQRPVLQRDVLLAADLAMWEKAQ